MITLSARVQIVLGITLATLMAATRGRHFGALEYVPTASWTVFFLAGIYLRSRWIYTAFLAEAALLDFAAITWGGVGSFCVSPAYGFLLPAYGMLWGPAGSSRRAWHSSRHVSGRTSLVFLCSVVLYRYWLCRSCALQPGRRVDGAKTPIDDVRLGE